MITYNYQQSEECKGDINMDFEPTRRPRKVAVYGRVSTEHDAQVSAYDNQVQWLDEQLRLHPEWTLVKQYGDLGVTGTSAEKRPDFMRMMQDAQYGEFDLIVTREVSRFARNTVVTLDYVRKLKEIGVEVFFVSDNIWTFKEQEGEFKLSIMSAVAQEESHKISDRVKHGQEISRKNKIYYGNGNILGYDRHCTIIDGVKSVDFSINKEQAETVRKIFDLYLEGCGVRKIKFELERLGYKTAGGKTTWYESNISKILQNPFYAGKIVYGKEYVVDYLSQKRRLNLGERPTTIVDGKHPPIISQEEFDRVQAGFEASRRQLDSINPERKKPRMTTIGKKHPVNVWTKLLECECGHKFNRKKWHITKEGKKQYAYQCYARIRSGSVITRENHELDTDVVCKSPTLPEWKLQMMANHLFHDHLEDTKRLVDFAEMLLKETEDAKETSDRRAIIDIKKIDAEIAELKKKNSKLIDLLAGELLSVEEYKEQKNIYDAELNRLRNRKEELLPSNAPTTPEIDYKQKLNILKTALNEFAELDESRDIPEEVIDAFVEKIIVHEDHLEWYLRFKPDPDDPVRCHVEGDKRKGNNPTFAYGRTDCHQGLIRTLELVSWCDNH